MINIKNDLDQTASMPSTEKEATVAQLKAFEKNKVSSISSLLEKLQANSDSLPIADAGMIEKLKEISAKTLENIDMKIEDHLAYVKPIQIS